MLERFLEKGATDLLLAESAVPNFSRASRRVLAVLAGLAAIGRPIGLAADDPCSPEGGMCDGNVCCPPDYHSTSIHCPGGGNCWESFGGSGQSCCDCYPDGVDEDDPDWLDYICWCSEGEIPPQ